ncbi:MAG TPA: hypothetical protein VKX17_28450 [Planctomycetota bacterium]|nr:hypothetical protein [Planctomycetota bacterium]
MNQTPNSALIRLKFLVQFIPELQAGTPLYDSVMQEAFDLLHRLENHQENVRIETESEIRMPVEVNGVRHEKELSATRRPL